MAKTFLDHLIVLEEITSELDVYDLPADEREEIIGLVHHTTHQHLLNVILNSLPQEHHQKFLSTYAATPHDPELLAYLKREIKADIESEIRIQAKKIKSEILAEIKKSRK